MSKNIKDNYEKMVQECNCVMSPGSENIFYTYPDVISDMLLEAKDDIELDERSGIPMLTSPTIEKKFGIKLFNLMKWDFYL